MLQGDAERQRDAMREKLTNLHVMYSELQETSAATIRQLTSDLEKSNAANAKLMERVEELENMHGQAKQRLDMERELAFDITSELKEQLNSARVRRSCRLRR